MKNNKKFEINRRKRGHTTIYNDEWIEPKKQKNDYRVVEKDGVVYTVVGSPEEINDNGDIHDIIQQTNAHIKEKPISPISSRIRSRSRINWKKL